jgi:hypothetical protein
VTPSTTSRYHCGGMPAHWSTSVFSLV